MPTEPIEACPPETRHPASLALARPGDVWKAADPSLAAFVERPQAGAKSALGGSIASGPHGARGDGDGDDDPGLRGAPRAARRHRAVRAARRKARRAGAAAPP